MSSGPKTVENRGGKREGSGRKAFSTTEKAQKKMLKCASKWAKKLGISMDDILMSLIYSRTPDDQPLNVDARVKVSAIKVFKEFTMGKLSEQNVNINDTRGPQIGLPEMRPDPAKTIFQKVKEANA
jgi:hypothetical protein